MVPSSVLSKKAAAPPVPLRLLRPRSGGTGSRTAGTGCGSRSACRPQRQSGGHSQGQRQYPRIISHFFAPLFRSGPPGSLSPAQISKRIQYR